MFKVFIIAAIIAVVVARPQGGHGHNHEHHDHGHAYSSQSIVLHHEPHYDSHQAQQDHHDLHYETYQPQEEHHFETHKSQEGLHHALNHETHDEHHNQEHHIEHKHVDYYAEPKYEYAYEIKDPHTHDFKQQHEHRNGDTVKGEYSLHQPDGTVRIVKYYADKKTGFHADVKYEGHSQHIVPEHDNQQHQ